VVEPRGVCPGSAPIVDASVSGLCGEARRVERNARIHPAPSLPLQLPPPSAVASSPLSSPPPPPSFVLIGHAVSFTPY
jgi:hypothetical protein